MLIILVIVLWIFNPWLGPILLIVTGVHAFLWLCDTIGSSWDAYPDAKGPYSTFERPAPPENEITLLEQMVNAITAVEVIEPGPRGQVRADPAVRLVGSARAPVAASSRYAAPRHQIAGRTKT